MDIETISLRPLALKPGGGVNPFASFAKGAGANLKNRTHLIASSSDEKKKPRGDVIKYPRDFLMKFAEHYNQVPQTLQHSNLEILLDPNDPDREAQKALLRSTADDSDDRDWRTRAPLPSEEAGQRKEKSEGGNKNIQRATDIGRKAWAAGTTAEGTEASIRKVKGILNKLTPEKFERLLSQLIPMVDSYEILSNTITQVFENAVQQPTFVAMYADFCAELDAALPEFPPPPDQENAPLGFRKMLANTCQIEYESTEEARARAAALPPTEREEAERRAKQRLLGNIRLIAELFKKGMVNDRIMLLILADLLGPGDSEPAEDSVEAVCELLSIAGGSLESSVKSTGRLNAAFEKLTKMSASKTYANRIRFVIKDLLELRSQHWVNTRREAYTAKKLEEIRSEAQAELGILEVAIPGIDALPAIPGLSARKAEDVELFPAFKGTDYSRVKARDDGKFSAFLGEFVPLAEASAAQPTQSRPPRTDLTPEQRESLARSIFTDYLSSPSIDEAVGAAQELEAPGFAPHLVQIGLEKAFDVVGDGEQTLIIDLLSALASRGVLNGEDVRDGVGALTETLEDIALDIPSAPRLLGHLLGSVAAGGLVSLGEVGRQASSIESAEPRRAFVAAALKAVQETSGSAKLTQLCKDSALDGNALLAADPEFDPDLPDVATFLKQQGLQAVPL